MPSKTLTASIVMIAALAAAFAFSAQAQDELEYGYADLAMNYEYVGSEIKYSVRNVGTETATGVTVSFRFKDLQASSSVIRSAGIVDNRGDDDTKEQWFTWEIGTILPGDASSDLTFSTGVHRGCETPRPEKIGVITATASSNQPEPDALLGNSEITVYSYTDGSTGECLHMQRNWLGLLLSVDDLRPAAGGDVTFDLTARSMQGGRWRLY